VTVREEFYHGLESMLGGFRPTTGFVALACLMEQPYRELHICGFTFFRTRYADGYNDEIAAASDAAQWVRSTNLHEPDNELRAFADLYRRHAAAGKRINLDRTLQELVSACTPHWQPIRRPHRPADPRTREPR
jgi:hypothetical protein